MKAKNFFLIALFGTLFVACKPKKSLSNYLVDSWQTSYIKVVYAHENDSISIFEDDFSKDNVTLAQSIYKNDGTFKAWYLLADGRKSGESDGKWKIENDSLFVEFTSQGKLIRPSYFIEKTDGGIALKSVFDWDGDGKKDDILTMRSKKIVLDK